VLGDVAGAVLARFLADADQRSLEALARAAGAGNLRLWSSVAFEQQAFVDAGVDGGIPSGEGDFLGVIVNNAAGNKADYYLEQEVSYDVTLLPDGSAIAEAEVRLTNDAPDSGLPPYVIGPFPESSFAAGENLAYLSVYCAPGCQPQRSTADGEPAPIPIEFEAGRAVMPWWEPLPPGSTRTRGHRWSVADAWHVQNTQGVYRLSWMGQSTVRPPTLDLRVRIPEGTRVVSADERFNVDGDVFTWRGVTGADSAFEFTFESMSPPRALHEVKTFLDRPLGA
jgi:hypothetical protein